MARIRLTFALVLLLFTPVFAQVSAIEPPPVYRDTATLRKNLALKPSLAKSRYEGGLTLLHFAAMTGDTTGALTLLEKGADPNARDKFGQTPLHKSQITAVAELLMNAGADPSIRDNNGRTPLDVALLHGNKAVAEFLISKGADVNAHDAYGKTPPRPRRAVRQPPRHGLPPHPTWRQGIGE